MSPEGITAADLPCLDGILESPSGKKKPVDLKEGPDNSIMASFVPDEPGMNKLHLNKDKKPVDGSPVPVLAREKPIIGRESQVPLECNDCDIPEDLPKMKGILTRPNGKDEPCLVEEGPDNTIAVSFVPEEPGKHLITVLKDNKQIEDSPYVVMVEGQSPDQYPRVGHPCDKDFHQPEPCNRNDINKMVSTLRRPTGKEEPVDVKLGPDGTIAVSFIPTEAGEHLVSVKKDGHHVPHSPFSIMVIDEPTMPTVGSECAANFDIPELDLPKDLKLLKGTLTRPNGKEEPLELGVGPDNSLAINFIPLEPGKHLIGIKKRGKHVKDSPFEIMVAEAKPKSKGPTVGQDCAANLQCDDLHLPDDLEHLTGEVDCPNGEKKPVDLSVSPDGTLDVHFTPEMPGEHLVHVAKKGKPIKDSPFPIMVEDGEPTGPTVDRECAVNLDIPELSLPRDLKNVTGDLTRPGGKKEPLECDMGPDKTLAVAFTPTEPGKHLIDIKKRGRPVKGSPFEVDVAPASGPVPVEEDIEIVPETMGDVESTPYFLEPEFAEPEFLDKDEPATVGSPCLHSLGVESPKDIKHLDGTVTSPSGEKTPADLRKGPDGTLAVAFTPEEPGPHIVDVEKNGKPIPGSPFTILAEEPCSHPKVGDTCNQEKDVPGVTLPSDLKDLKASVTAPSGKKAPVECTSTPDKNLGLEFTPEEPGLHLIDVTKRGKPVDGSPFEVYVVPDEDKPNVGDPCNLEKDVPGVTLPSDLKDLKASVKAPSGKKAPVECTTTPDNNLGLEFTPEEPGLHLIDVTKRGKPVEGSPFEVYVVPEEPKVGDACNLEKGVPDVKLPSDLKDLKATVKAPSGKKAPVECTTTPDNNLGLEFTPEEPGLHLIDVTKHGKPVEGSPFEVYVVPDEEKPKVGDACSLEKDVPGVTLPSNLKDLKASVTAPSGKKAPVECTTTPDKNLGLEFTPEEPGLHLIDVTKRGKPVDGSPFEVYVVPDEDKPNVGDPCNLEKDVPDVTLPCDLKDLKASVTAPSGKKAPVECTTTPDKNLGLEFTPEEPGLHLIDVTKHGKPVDGSPFEVYVVPEEPKVGDTCNLEKGVPDVKLPSDLKDLEASVTAPSGKKAPVECTTTPDKNLGLEFTPEEPGLHLIDVTKRGKPVEGSPFEVYVVPDEDKPNVGDPCNLEKDVPDVTLPCDLKDLEASVTAPSGKKAPVECTTTPDKNLGLEFTPEEPGLHLIDVTKHGKPVEGSPFEVYVVPEEPKVGDTCNLEKGVPDVKLPSDLEHLEASVTAPSGKKAPVECTTTPDKNLGLEFTPEEPGLHLIDVTKHGKPVDGSPFEVYVVPDEDKPNVGDACNLEKDVPGVTLPSDIRDLKASVTAPSGKKAPVECTTTPDKNLGLEFTPEEPGLHLIDVTKRGKPVDGSPFEVFVVPEEPKVGDTCNQEKDVPGVTLPCDLEHLKATVKAPSGKEAPVECTTTPDNNLGLEFTPEEPGLHLIDVTKLGKPVAGSPFEVYVVPDEEKPKVRDVCNLEKDVPDVTLPSDLKDLNATVKAPSGKKAPVECTITPEKILGLEFTPEEPGLHLIDVTKHGKPVDGSPFEVFVVPEEPKVGDTCNLEKDIPGVTLPCDLKDLKATVKAPCGKKAPVECTITPENNLGLEFTPEEPGKHVIDVTKKGHPVKGSPFEVIVAEKEPSQPKVGDVCDLDYDLPDVTLPKDLKDLKATLTRPDGKKEPVECTSTPDNHLGLEFTPEEPGRHVIDVTKKGKPVNGSPFEIIVAEKEPSQPKVGDVCDLDYDLPDVTLPKDLKDLKATLTRPDGKKEPVECTSTPDNHLGLEFTPEEPGRHVIDVTKKGKPVNGSPFEIIVAEKEPSQPKVGDVCDLDYDLPDVTLPKDLKDLKATLTRPDGKKEPVECTSTPDNHLGLEFTPEEPGRHVIDVTKKGKPVNGSPFVIMVDEDTAQAKPTVGSKCEVDYDIPDVTLPRDLKDLTATITRPTGKKEPIECSVTPDNTLGLEFTPKEPGTHIVDVYKRGHPVKGSPFEIHVEEETGVGSKPTVGHKCDADFDIPEITLPRDLSKLKAKLLRPDHTEEEITCACSPDNTLSLEFTPKHPGEHKIVVTKHGKPVNGSPFIIMVEEDTDTSPEAKPTVGNKCEVDFDIPDVSLPKDLPDLKAELTRPSGVKEDIACISSPDNTLGLEFTPAEPGKHIIKVTKNGRPVRGSPFVVMVEEDTSADSKPTVGHKCDVDFDIPDVNLPSDLHVLKAILRRPNGAEEPVECNCTADNTLGLEFTPNEPGKHVITVTKNGRPVKGSPFVVMVEEDTCPTFKTFSRT